MMKKDNLEQLEEDAIHSGHSDDYISFTNRCKDQWYDGIFSLDEDSYENRSTHKDEKEDYTDLITSITKDQGLLKLYQAVSFSLLAEEGKKRGLPEEVASSLVRNALIGLNHAHTTDQLVECSHWIEKRFHDKYVEFHYETYSYHVKKAVELIYQYKRKQISLEKIAGDLKLNPSYLSRIFKKETGKTVSEYILMVKMDQAKLLMESGVYQLHEVSELMGYSSYTYFSQRFKKYFGVSPEQYLKENRS